MTTTNPPGLLDRIRRSIDRDSALPLSTRIEKAVRFGVTSALAPVYLLGCDRVGPWPRTWGRPVISNAGHIEIGARALLGSQYAPVQLSTGPQGKIEIGDDVILNYGSSISARRLVKLGDRVSFGPYVTVSDDDGEAGDTSGPAPITIGDDVWLATRVRLRKGAVIGRGSVIAAGSEVSGEIPPGVLAGGVPARVIRRLDRTGGPPGEEVPPAASPRGSEQPTLRGVVAGDFDLRELAVHLRAPDPLGPRAEATVAPWGEAFEVAPGTDFAVVWTHPESIAPFRDLVLGREVEAREVLLGVDSLVDRIQEISKSVRCVLVPAWVLPPFERGLGASDLGEGGVARTLLRMNLHLAEALDGTPGVVVLDTSRWVAAAGPAAMSQKLRFLADVDFSARVFAEAAADIRSALRGLCGTERRLLVLGLAGALRRHAARVGEGGRDPAGEAFDEFQRRVEALRRRGVILAVTGESEAPDAGIRALAAERGLGLSSVVFLGEDPAERARVREALPEVFVPDWPSDELLYPQALLALRCFDAPFAGRGSPLTDRSYSIQPDREEARHG